LKNLPLTKKYCSPLVFLAASGFPTNPDTEKYPAFCSTGEVSGCNCFQKG